MAYQPQRKSKTCPLDPNTSPYVRGWWFGVDPITETKRFWYWGSMKPFWGSVISKTSDPRSDPRFTDPEKTWVSNSSIATSLRGPLGFGPIQFLMNDWIPRDEEDAKRLDCRKNRPPGKRKVCFAAQEPSQDHLSKHFCREPWLFFGGVGYSRGL